MNFPFYIAKRYLFSKSSNNTINIITRIATAGVIVGTLALFIVLSGFSGLRAFSVGFLDTSDPDIKITSVKGKSFDYTSKIASVLNNQRGIASFSKIVEERAFFEFHNKTHIAHIKGIDKNYTTVNSIDSTVYVGTWLDNKIPHGVVIGNGISNTLSVGIFDFLEPLKIYVPKPGKGYTTNLKNAFNKINTQPVGIFGLNDELDKKYTFTSLQLAQNLLSYSENQISAIELKVLNIEDRAGIVENLKLQLGSDFDIKTREQLNAVFYKMLNTENLASYLIFTLILIIALFNVIGAIIMMILDKRDNLKTLYSIGATIKEIKRVFILQGFMLSVLGLTIGLSIGIILVLLQKKFELFMITQHLAYPVELTFLNVISVIITMIVLGYLAAKIASSRISKRLVE